MSKWVFPAAAAVALLALPPTSFAADPGLTEAGHVIFEHHCRICHADDPALKSYGPPLAGVIGRKAGTYPNYTYSEAMKNAGITWTPEAIKAWMADNKALLPGTRMRHVGVTDSVEQDLIAVYLQSLSK
jgi:cytochrome c